jgi:prepilin-type N-terminal cleavage/methylation domain-containing protein
MISARQPDRRTRRGLTLIELTVVMAILAMLMLIALPAVNQVVAQARTDESKAMIRNLEAGCLEFGEDVGFLPRSRDAANYSDWTGAQLLRLQLTGYGPDKGQDGIPGDRDNPELIAMDIDDGLDGFGFKRNARGQNFGPYMGADEIDFQPQANDRSVFIDAFGNEIYYYCGTGGYKTSDNEVTAAGSEFEIDDYAANEDGRFWKSDILIFSAGADGLIKAFVPGDENPTDDITNFLPE